MTRITIFISIAMICLSCAEGETDSKIKISEFILSNYLDDSKDLYMREIAADPNHPNYTVAELDTVEITKIITALQLVYAMQSPESDSVFELYEVHAVKFWNLSSLALKVNPNLPEIANLANEVIPTGNSALDALLDTYKFDDVSSYNYPASPYLYIQSEKDYNMIPVINQFRELNVFLSVENNYWLSFLMDGDLVMSRVGEDLIFDFSSSSFRGTFKFKVHNNVPEFLGH